MFERWDDQEPTAWNIVRAALGGVFLAMLFGAPIAWLALTNMDAIQGFLSANLGALRPN